MVVVVVVVVVVTAVVDVPEPAAGAEVKIAADAAAHSVAAAVRTTAAVTVAFVRLDVLRVKSFLFPRTAGDRRRPCAVRAVRARE